MRSGIGHINATRQNCDRCATTSQTSAMCRRINSIRCARDRCYTLTCGLRSQVRCNELAVRRCSSGTHNCQHAMGQFSKVAVAFNPQTQRCAKFKIIKLFGPLNIAGNDEPSIHVRQLSKLLIDFLQGRIESVFEVLGTKTCQPSLQRFIKAMLCNISANTFVACIAEHRECGSNLSFVIH